MANPANIVTLTGRLANDVRFFENKDGSRILRMTLAISRNYKVDGERPTDFVQVEGFIPAKVTAKTPFDMVGKGDLVSVAAEIRSNVFEKGGETRYEQVVHVTDITMLESQAVTEARRAQGETAAAVAA